MGKHRSQKQQYINSELYSYVQGTMNFMINLQKKYPEIFNNPKATENEKYDLFVFGIFRKLFAGLGELIEPFDKGQIPGYFTLARLYPKITAYRETVKGVAPVIDLVDKLGDALPGLIEIQLRQLGGLSPERYPEFKNKLLDTIRAQKDSIFKSIPEFARAKLGWLLAELDRGLSTYCPDSSYIYDKKTVKNQSQILASAIKFSLLQHCLNQTPVIEINTPLMYELIDSLYRIFNNMPSQLEAIIPFFNPYVVDFDTTSGILSSMTDFKFIIKPCEKDREDMDLRFDLTVFDEDKRPTKYLINGSHEFIKGKNTALMYFGIAFVDYFVKNLDKKGPHQENSNFQRFRSFTEMQLADIEGFARLPSESLPAPERLEVIKAKQQAVEMTVKQIQSLTLAQLLNHREDASMVIGHFVLPVFKHAIANARQVLEAERLRLEPGMRRMVQPKAVTTPQVALSRVPEKEPMDLLIKGLSSIDFDMAAAMSDERVERPKITQSSLSSLGFFARSRDLEPDSSKPSSSMQYR